MSRFDFKHFSIQQENAALKVGTDAMLLGSIAHFESNNHFLDIGTGTGVLSLMLAQRFQPTSITALEIEPSAILDAQVNFSNSPFETKIHLNQIALQQFQTDELFDGIISNPPYFNNSQKNIQLSKTNARHTDSLSYDALLIGIDRLLTEKGKAWIILPIESLENFTNLILSNKTLVIEEQIIIEGKPGKAVRFIVSLVKNKSVKVLEKTLVIRNHDNSYTDDYRSLTEDFHNKKV